MAVSAEIYAGYQEYVIDTCNSIQVQIPGKPLAHQSLYLETVYNKPFTSWSENDHANSFSLLRKIVFFWKREKIADQYLIYGKAERGDNSFHWEVVPYYKAPSIIGRLWQQFLVLCKITFGGSKLYATQLQRQQEIYKDFSRFSPDRQKIEDTYKRSDAFCKETVINKQKVLEGRHVEILFSHAPIGFGGEKLHFLIVPKLHRETFGDLTCEEYQEAMEWSQKLITYFTASRPIQNVYLYHKTGVDAGQSVPHWHLHVVLTSNKAQDFFGKLTVLKNMMLGSSPMKDDELILRVTALHSELHSVK